MDAISSLAVNLALPGGIFYLLDDTFYDGFLATSSKVYYFTQNNHSCCESCLLDKLVTQHLKLISSVSFAPPLNRSFSRTWLSVYYNIPGLTGSEIV